ncbi:hypothetical protein EPK99_06520 [Neorhizobium lilium]|uniref:Uncharacterized protein n=1 Tax=Neorhizobium lilium TaxID=2503024 RepID=A0A3S3S6W4_9HYPH|nr:hypothetical protein [Neorhizobium lilium]RWX78282.1 hypothetical protein EPK99_06520 [Neorhizobium lilium]
MNEAQIIEIFVKAAEVDRKLPDSARPAKLKATNHGYVHDTADLNGWFSDDKHAANWAWLDPANLRNTTNDMGLWSAAMELIKLVPSEKNRRALWAWARSEAGGKAFAKWCREVEGISRQVGNYRKNAAVLHIARALDRKPLQHNDIDGSEAFTSTPEIEDKQDIIEVWRADDAVPLVFDESLRDFSWSAAQNERRRQREARRKQAA